MCVCVCVLTTLIASIQREAAAGFTRLRWRGRWLLNALMFSVGENELKTTVSPTASRHNPRRLLGGFLLTIKTPWIYTCRDGLRSVGPRVSGTRRYYGGSPFKRDDRMWYR